ncbi:MAG: general stress protein [Pseudomonadota bacterium]|nr:general stress protein [Pseudomonadota bacterium]
MPKEKEENNPGGYSSGTRGKSSENLSEAARKMRSADPEERREGAAEMGHVGGQHSHGGHGMKGETPGGTDNR